MTPPPVRHLASLTVPLATAAAVAVTAPAPATGSSTTVARRAAAPAVPTLVAIRAAHRPGLDRVVFEFRGPLPTHRTAAYVPTLTADPSGRRVRVAGDAILRVRFAAASGHVRHGDRTYGPTRRTFPLPEVIQVVNVGDFEAVLGFGIGLSQREPYRMYPLTHPNRVVLDIRTPFRTVPVKDYFLRSQAFATGRQPYLAAVRRPVIPPATVRGALQRLFAGPTRAEYRRGLRLVSSGATGFSSVSIHQGIARVRLTGNCGSGGSTFTIADEIVPTLRQFPTIRWVKIYDRYGDTERPNGRVDSVPECLEP